MRRVPGWGVDPEFMRGWRRLASFAIGGAITSERSREPSVPLKAVARCVGARKLGESFLCALREGLWSFALNDPAERP